MTFLNYTLQAINGALTSDKYLMAKIDGVYDEVPNTAKFPYVTIGEGEEKGKDMFGTNASNLKIPIDVFSRGEAKGTKEAIDIAQIIEGILDKGLTSENANLIVLNYLEAKPEKIPLEDKTILRHVELLVEIFAQQK